jgi:hypothetical protein
MKIDQKLVVVIIIAVLLLIGYLTYPFVLEGLSAGSVDTQISTIQKQLSPEKYKNPTDIVLMGQKIDLLTQGITILNKVLADTKLMKEDKKKNYQTILADWQRQLAPLPKKLADAKAALDASRKKPTR